jgi:hypothetical protein
VREVLNGAIGTGEEQGRVAVVVPSDAERLSVVQATRFENLALAVMLTRGGATYHELITCMCLHIRASAVVISRNGEQAAGAFVTNSWPY